ncbi:MAG: hexameric tyrosine-coordinated heme protein [Acidimicrobiales bacterium]
MSSCYLSNLRRWRTSNEPLARLRARSHSGGHAHHFNAERRSYACDDHRRHTIHNIQPDLDVLAGGRPNYSTTPDSLIAASHVVAVEFATIAAANNFWRQ